MRSQSICASIEEHSLLLRMPMQIKYHPDLPLLMCIKYLILNEVDLRVKFLGRIFPSPIEITTNQRATIIAMSHSIWIDHRKYFKHE